MKLLNCPTIAAISLVVCCFPAAHAAQETPSASASAAAAPSASASANAGLLGIPISDYVWPKETSEQPKDDEWPGATELESMTAVMSTVWNDAPVTCRLRALREWVRLECYPPDRSTAGWLEDQHFYGSLWGLAGDISGVSGQFPPVAKSPQYSRNRNPQNVPDRLVLGMGASGVVIFQAKYGSAFMARLDQIFWADFYDGAGSVLVTKGILIDVAWALGEKYPTFTLKG